MKNIQKSLIVSGGYVSRSVPLGIEHFGRWGTKAENFLQHLSQQSIQKPILMPPSPCLCRIGEKDFLQFYKDAMLK